MPFTVAEINRGLANWPPHWPQDFHTAFYVKLDQINHAGMFNEAWWGQLRLELGSWYAHRPKSYAFLDLRAEERLHQLHDQWNAIPQAMRDGGIENPDVHWGALGPFAETVREIKNVMRPVFCSKMCHFIAPRLFVVVDGRMTGFLGGLAYGDNWNCARDEWIETAGEVRQALLAIMLDRLPNDAPENYPLVTKCIELCLIGRNLATPPH